MKKALLVGINNYPAAPLKGCIKDATEVGALLQTNGDQNPNFDVLVKKDVLRIPTLRGLIQNLFSGEADTALFYFSGHGSINELGGFLVTPDCQPHSEGISMNELLTFANKSKIRNKIIILDCCHSGAITAPVLTHDGSGHINEGITLLTASRCDEVAMEVNGHGIFTSLLIEALKGGASDVKGDITPGSIYTYIHQALGPWHQRPIFKTNVSSFTPLRTVAPKLPVKDLRQITEYFASPEIEFQLDSSFEYTNNPNNEPVRKEPYAKPAHVAIFKILQQMQGAGLVTPVGEAHMYWAAMHGKSCRLTPLGEHYWRLVKERKI